MAKKEGRSAGETKEMRRHREIPERTRNSSKSGPMRKASLKPTKNQTQKKTSEGKNRANSRFHKGKKWPKTNTPHQLPQT